jgi:hypothetical protein
MPDHAIDYGRLVERALRQVVHDALEVVAEQACPGTITCTSPFAPITRP